MDFPQDDPNAIETMVRFCYNCEEDDPGPQSALDKALHLASVITVANKYQVPCLVSSATDKWLNALVSFEKDGPMSQFARMMPTVMQNDVILEKICRSRLAWSGRLHTLYGAESLDSFLQDHPDFARATLMHTAAVASKRSFP